MTSVPDRARWIVELRVSEMSACRAGCLRFFGSGVAEYMMLTVTRAQSAAERERSAVAWRLGQFYNTVSSWIMYPVCPVHIVEMCGAMFVVSGLLCFLERNLGTVVSSGIAGNNCGQSRPPALAIARAPCSPSEVAVAIPSERFYAMCGQ